jgi:hypothetical protein
MTCETIQRDAAGLASLRAGDPERESAYAHARSCPACRAALGEGERLMAMIGALARPAPSEAALRRAARPVLESLPARPSRALPALVAGTAVLLAVAGRSPSHAARDVLAGAALAVAAAAVAALARRGWLVAAGAVAVSSAAAALHAGAGPFAWQEGVRCLATELAAAALPLVVAVGLWRREVPGAWDLASAAAAGALAGQAALALNCHGPDSAAHVLGFHVAGVVLALALGASARVAVRPRVA